MRGSDREAAMEGGKVYTSKLISISIPNELTSEEITVRKGILVMFIWSGGIGRET